MPTDSESAEIHADNGIPILLDAFVTSPISAIHRGTKRSLELDNVDERISPKGPRLNEASLVSRYNVSDGQIPQNDSRNKFTSEGDIVGNMNVQNTSRLGDPQGFPRHVRSNHTHRPGFLPRGACRDYHSTYSKKK